MQQNNSHENPFAYSLYAVARGLVPTGSKQGVEIQNQAIGLDSRLRGNDAFIHLCVSESHDVSPDNILSNPPSARFAKGGTGGLKGFGILTCALLILLLAIIPGCSRKFILSDDAVRIRNIHEFVRELRGLYEQRDIKILTRFSPDFLTEIGDPIQKDFEKFNSISLDLFTDRIEMYNGDVNISIQWNGIWKSSEKTYREGGSMVLLTRYGEEIKIIGIKGDSPFGITSSLGNSDNKFLPELK